MVLRFFLFAFVFLFMSCGYERDNPHDPDGINFIGGGYVPKGNNIANYRTTKIGDQVWMAENLDYDVSGSRCYNDNPAACATYGRLYDWATAMNLPSSCNSSSCASQVSVKHRGICPSGWHIPSDAEWTTLTDYVGGASTAGTKLKSREGWNNNGNGTDAFGFSALPGGFGLSAGGFYGVGHGGYWWSSTEGSAGAYSRYMGSNYELVDYYSYSKDDLQSVRCLQD